MRAFRHCLTACCVLFSALTAAQPVIEEGPSVSRPDNVPLKMLGAARVAALDQVIDQQSQRDARNAGVSRRAEVHGLWCGVGALRDFSMDIAQHYQKFDAKLTRRDRVRDVTGTIEGATLRTEQHRNGSLVLEVVGDQLHITGGTGALALVRGQSFARAQGSRCGA